MTHPIPAAALDDRLGFFGTAGSGKTFGAGTAVERLLARGNRVAVIDPLGVWYGLRLALDGKTPSPWPVVIFGGPHGDLALTEHSGAVIGETVATMRESCIIDLSQLGTKAAERRFMLAFLTALYRNASREPLHLVFDEADMWAPQRLLDKEGDAAKLLGQMETIVRRGRVLGFIPWLITQRPAVLSKDVLSQIDGLVSFKVTSSQDRDQIGAWVEGQADLGQWKEIKAKLPTLDRGTALVWLPTRGALTVAPFPPKATFDSSATPKRGEKRHHAELKPLDVEGLRGRLAVVQAEAVENDPKRLKAEVARLKAELAKKGMAGPAGVPAELHKKAVAAAEARGFERGRADGHHDGFVAGHNQACATFRSLMLDQVDRLTKAIGEAMPACVPPRGAPAPRERVNGAAVARPQREAPAAAARPARAASAAPARPAAGASEPLSGGERKILTVLAQYPDGRTKRQVAILTGYAHGGGGFNNYLSALRSRGRIVSHGDAMRITDAGLAALGDFDPLPTGPALLDHWLGQLDKAPRAVLEALASIHPSTLSKVEVAAATGYEAGGGGFNNALSRLRTLGLIEGRGELRASDELFG